MIINTVTVLGATGTMGANIAGIFAAFGNAKVYCVGRDIDKVIKTIPKIISSVKADSISARLVPADFSDLERCVSDSDLIFESSAEDIEVKREIAKRVGVSMRKDAVSCTGTSGLSINTLAEAYPVEVRGRFFGVHMFNPPYSMPLCEFSASKYSDPILAEEMNQYLANTLFRTVVPVQDLPAFLGNRIGFQFINEALLFAERFKDSGGIDYIDAVLGPFTGRSMAPLMTSDFVGLDVHKAIVNNIYQNTNDYAHDTFQFPAFAQKLITQKKLGRKTGCGLYQFIKYDNGLKRTAVYDIATGTYRDRIPYVFPFAEAMKKHLANGQYEDAMCDLIANHSLEAEICLEFLLKYIVYSLYAAKKVGESFEAADDVMATGFNWCPPLALAKAISSVTNLNSLIHERLSEICNRVTVDELLAQMPKTKYDYRPFFKSGR